MPQMEIISPVTGTVWKIERAVGDTVSEGDVIMILESMKMEIPVEAPQSGILVSLSVEPGGSVDEDQVLGTVQA